ncbi:MAG: UDP-N-acetylmuramate dehydrogenase [Patescibacteria group bacterium]|nr:UDP-N-acetylmuramate dehydrogenase [Patescibacteria group bacterium]
MPIDITQKLTGVIENEPMSRHTTYRIGGPAEFFYRTKTTDDLVKAIIVARQLQLPLFILGRGSNILVADKGIKGLVISVETTERTKNNNLVTVAAGAGLGEFVIWTINQGLAGIEFASGIPGTIGGAIRGNAGAFGSEMKDFVESIEVLTAGNVRKILPKSECAFGYRESVFKHSDDIILTSTFKLRPGNKAESLALVDKYMKQRTAKQDYSIPSAGCVFINPLGNPAARLIDELGLKGARIGDAQISSTHANFIINAGQAKASEVVKLIALIKEKVKEKYGIELREEIQLVGF